MKWVGMSNRAIARALGTDEKNVRRFLDTTKRTNVANAYFV